MAHASAPAEPRHLVQFYEDVAVLADQVAVFAHKALHAGGAAVIVARPAALALIETRLTNAGHDPAALRGADRLHLIDAAELLAQLLVDGAPDHARFQQHVGTLLRRMATHGTVHAYGEMVDILLAAGNSKGVIALETFWSELLREVPAILVCGYNLSAFDRDVPGFELLCDHHDVVEPTHPVRSPAITTPRVIAQLEQRARALEMEVELRRRLERRMHELLELSSQLAAADDRQLIGRLVVDKGMQALGAIDAAFWILAPERTHLELVAATGNLYSAETMNRYRVMAMNDDIPAVRAIRTGEPLFLGSMAEHAARFPESSARLKPVLTDHHRAFAVLPVMVDDEPLGVLVYTFHTEREFSAADRAFKGILARQCGLALARVQQMEQERVLRQSAERAAVAEKEARTEIELLYDLIASVNQLDDIDAVYYLALNTVRGGTRSERAAILLFDPDGVMRFKAAQGLSDTYKTAVEGHTPWSQDAINPAPIAVNDTETDPAWLLYRDVFRAEGIRALAFVPIVHGRQLIGKFMLYRNEPRPFESTDLQFTATVAIHVAQAIERRRNETELARSYRVERDAHLEADEATRAREEILSVVSHDLRNPLGTILMGATSLLNLDIGDRSHRIRTIAERIHRQAERMARLIEDLVDFAGIQAGQLAIERKLHKPEDILAQTSDIFGPMAHERGLRFESWTAPGLPPIDCDCERAVQVMSNLVANALKVTPKGGAIAIGAEPKDDEVVFYVRDTGPGIADDELPQLFERYWRSKHSQYKGAGLGLSIARGIVDAHGGRIWAESQLGRGATFYFSLASLRNN